LRVIDVLVLVYENVAEFVLPAGACFDVAFQESDRLADQIVKIEPVVFAQTALVFAVDRSITLACERRVFGLNRIGGLERVLGAADAIQRRARRELPLVVSEIRNHFAHQRALIGIVEDRKIGTDAGFVPVAAQDAHARRVERERPNIARGFTDHFVQTALEFRGGFVGERHRKDAIRKDILVFDQVRNAVRQHARFAAAGAGEN
jgi:hypothetical protein